jgi:hypothetical protein
LLLDQIREKRRRTPVLLVSGAIILALALIEMRHGHARYRVRTGVNPRPDGDQSLSKSSL